MAGGASSTRVVDCAQEGRDERAVLDELSPRLVGVTAFTSSRHAALDILRYAKEAHGARTVIGGPHVTTGRIARQIAEHYPFVDHIVRGDGENVWRALVRGEPVDRLVLDYVDHLDALPVPAWDAVPVMQYPPRDEGIYHGVDLSSTPRVSVVFSRGCPGRCNFCSAWRRPMRRHSPAWVARALEPLAALGVRHLCLDDDCWATDEDNAVEIAGILGRLGFVWSAETRADLLTPELAEVMADNGCWSVAVGVEHGSQRMLDGPINKHLDLADVLRARAAAWDAGLKFVALLLSGYPGETDEDRQAQGAFMRMLQPDDTGTLGRTLVLPGTRLYSDAIASGAVNDDIWLGKARHLLALPDGTVESLVEAEGGRAEC